MLLPSLGFCFLSHFLSAAAASPLKRDEDQGLLDLRPQRECPGQSPGGAPAYYCPTSEAPSGPWTCIRAADLCNGIPDCPHGQDEDPTHCLFHLAERDMLDSLKGMVTNHFVAEHRAELNGPAKFSAFDKRRTRRLPWKLNSQNVLPVNIPI